jgi:hypothetical protein
MKRNAFADIFDKRALSHLDLAKLKNLLREDASALLVFAIGFPVVVAGAAYLLERLLTN